MFLRRMTLENVKCFESLEIDFLSPQKTRKKSSEDALRQWTVLLGQNGSGKTAVLRSIGLMLAGSDALSEVLGHPEEWIRLGADSASMTLEIQTQKGEVRELSLTIGRADSISTVISRSLEGLAPLNDALQHTSRNYFTVAYGASRRLGAQGVGSDRQSRFRHPRARSMATLFDRDAELNPLESWAMDLDYRGGNGLKVVQQVLSEFLPGMSFAGIDKRRKQLMFDTVDGSVPLQQLSEGFQNVAAWVGDLLYRVTETFEDYRTPLKTGGLLIVDEIDLHLHPIWQRRLIDFLGRKLPNLQLAVTTHSAVTAQQAGPESIHVLRRARGKGVEVEKFEADPRQLLVNQLLMTNAFGLDTDESLETEKKKQRRQTLKKKTKLSTRQRNELKELDSELGKIESASPSRPVLHEKQMAFLRRLEREMRRR